MREGGENEQAASLAATAAEQRSDCNLCLTNIICQANGLSLTSASASAPALPAFHTQHSVVLPLSHSVSLSRALHSQMSFTMCARLINVNISTTTAGEVAAAVAAAVAVDVGVSGNALSCHVFDSLFAKLFCNMIQT